MNARPLLVSHALCPYVQRVAITLHEKDLPFDRRDIDLAAKPDWFLALSPTGKTPMLLVEGGALFESAAICDYLDDTALPRLHPESALARARHRAWVEQASQLLNLIGALYSAADEAALTAQSMRLRTLLSRLEPALDPSGPFFAGPRFSLVDAAFAPALRYFELFDRLGDFAGFATLPRLQAWRQALAARPSVRAAVAAGYTEQLADFLRRRGGALAQRLLG